MIPQTGTNRHSKPTQRELAALAKFASPTDEDLEREHVKGKAARKVGARATRILFAIAGVKPA